MTLRNRLMNADQENEGCISLADAEIWAAMLLPDADKDREFTEIWLEKGLLIHDDKIIGLTKSGNDEDYIASKIHDRVREAMANPVEKTQLLIIAGIQKAFDELAYRNAFAELADIGSSDETYEILEQLEDVAKENKIRRDLPSSKPRFAAFRTTIGELYEPTQWSSVPRTGYHNN